MDKHPPTQDRAIHKPIHSLRQNYTRTLCKLVHCIRDLYLLKLKHTHGYTWTCGQTHATHDPLREALDALTRLVACVHRASLSPKCSLGDQQHLLSNLETKFCRYLQWSLSAACACVCVCVCVCVVCTHVCVCGEGEGVCCGFRGMLFCSTIFIKVLPMKPADSSTLLFWDGSFFCATGHESCVYIQTALLVGDIDTDSLCLAVLGTPFIKCRAAADYLPSLIGIIDL